VLTDHQRDAALEGAAARQLVEAERARDRRLRLEGPYLEGHAVPFKQPERDALRVQRMLELMRQDDSDDVTVRVLESYRPAEPCGNSAIASVRASVAGRSAKNTSRWPSVVSRAPTSASSRNGSSRRGSTVATSRRTARSVDDRAGG
jgi:hypothetical protein